MKNVDTSCWREGDKLLCVNPSPSMTSPVRDNIYNFKFGRHSNLVTTTAGIHLPGRYVNLSKVIRDGL